MIIDICDQCDRPRPISGDPREIDEALVGEERCACPPRPRRDPLVMHEVEHHDPQARALLVQMVAAGQMPPSALEGVPKSEIPRELGGERDCRFDNQTLPHAATGPLMFFRDTRAFSPHAGPGRAAFFGAAMGASWLAGGPSFSGKLHPPAGKQHRAPDEKRRRRKEQKKARRRNR